MEIKKCLKKRFDEVLVYINKTAEVLEECKIIKKEEDKIRYIEKFNDEYMFPIHRWIEGASFLEILEENLNMFEGSFIRIIRIIDEFNKSFEKSTYSIGNFQFQSKIKEIGNKIRRGLPFTSSLYLSEA